MTAFLPPNLLALFAPRDPVPYLEPATKLPHETKRCPIQGVAQYVQLFEVGVGGGGAFSFFWRA
jgi:U1 small nuclear ribonucleoprotein